MIMIMELIMMMDTVKSSQLLIRPSPRSGLGRALSIMLIIMLVNRIHMDTVKKFKLHRIADQGMV